jgi:hypothetical protein
MATAALPASAPFPAASSGATGAGSYPGNSIEEGRTRASKLREPATNRQGERADDIPVLNPAETGKSQRPGARGVRSDPASTQRMTSPTPALNQEKGRQQEEPRAEAKAKARRQRLHDLEAGLRERFTVKGREYRFRDNERRIAFEDHGRRLTTPLDLPSVIRALVDLAEARGWQSLRIGQGSSAEFSRAIWVEATARGIRAVGHEATAEDHARLDKRRSQPGAVKAAGLQQRDQQIRAPVQSGAAQLVTREAAARGVDDPAVLAKVRETANERQLALAKEGRTAVARVVDPSAARHDPQPTLTGPEHVLPARSR